MRRILIVEDNSDIATLYQRALMLHDNTVAHSAESAMMHLQENEYDLVILDLHLPARSGLDVLKNIRANGHSGTKVFVISADDLMRQTCEAIGIEAWMTKPIELDVFIDRVNTLLH